MLKLIAIGIAAGFFSALFGVGGGILIVPLLLLASFSERPAMATSLASIGLIALTGVVLYALRGRVDVVAAAAVGLPAALGAVAGATLQQRLANGTIRLLFALLLVGLGVRLLVA